MVPRLFWHPVSPESIQDELLTILSLGGKLLKCMLIHRVVVPAAIDFKALQARFQRNRLRNLEQELTHRLRRAAPQKFEPDFLSIRVVKLDPSLPCELRD